MGRWKCTSDELLTLGKDIVAAMNGDEEADRRIDQHILDTMPEDEPYLSRWTRIHALHQAAMANGDLHAACRLADQRFQVHLDWLRAWMG